MEQKRKSKEKNRKAKIEKLLDELYTNYYDLYIQVQSYCSRRGYSVFTFCNIVLDISEATGEHPISIIRNLYSDC